jgi:two-component system chemotaxis response regulator CheB
VSLRVLVIDDSAVVREAMVGLLVGVPGLQVMTAADPLIARQKMARVRPDVIVLDLEMPRMDGLTFLRELMRTDPIPVIICSGNTDDPEVALRALEIGAVDIVARPRMGVSQFLQDSAVLLIDAIRSAAEARLSRRPATPPPATPLALSPSERMVAVGASTGGTDAVRALLEPLPAECCGVVVVQHMPSPFTGAFAKRLDEICQLEVKEAAEGDRVTQGRALIAPGDRHLSVVRDASGYRVELSDGPLVARHRPSVDVLFRSVARAAGPRALGLLLTGMGNDGAAGLLEMKKTGAATIAQDEASCVVFGMPKEAIGLGAVDRVLPLPSMPSAVLAWSRA